MYAVIQTGGKQYRVAPGERVVLEKLPGDAGTAVEFDQVLLLSDQKDAITVGRPLIGGAKVTGQIVEQGRDDKVVVYKFKRRKNYRRRYGHRQAYTAVLINDVVAP